MCGISGIFSQTNNPNINEAILTRMLTRINHRGPDESGIYLGENIGIGNVRLSIIDISTGQQPLSDPSGRYWIVFNGEIFNYIELREELVKNGCKFRTHSDTEVIVQLFAKFGESAVEKMNGQFAFAIWDKDKKQLFLARDRVGIRPLFYSYENGTFTFGSEIKAILENPDVKAELSYKALSQVYTFWTTITPHTIFEGIMELPPGHYMTVNAKGIEINKFWSLDFSDQLDKSEMSIDEAKNRLDEIFADAIRIRLRADVPVAAYLSGGIDSSVTTAFIKKIEPNILKTFSIGFADSEFDETIFQQEAANYFGTEHYSIKVSNADIARNFFDVIWHTEIPTIRTAPTPMYLLSKLVRKNDIKVVITGEGADEMLGGYNIFKEAKIRNFWAKQPNSKIRPLLLKKLYPYLPQMQNSNAQMMKFFFGYKLTETELPYYSHLLRWNNTSHIIKLLDSNVLEQIKGYNPYGLLDGLLPSKMTSWDILPKAQWIESNIFMSGYLLSSQGDRMGMANSIEGRYPFLDHRVIEFCAKLPSDYKLNGLNEKYILKKLAKGKIPESVLNRPKQAYRAPIAKAFLNNDAPEYVNELLSEQSIKSMGVFSSKQVNSLVDKIKKSERPSELENMSLAAILSTSILHYLYIDNHKKSLVQDRLLKPRIIIEN